MRISIAMATFNGAKFLDKQLSSLVKQENLPDELIVCDDGSTDNTLEILHEFARRAPFPVSIHKNETNLGFSDNFMKAARLCSGDWVAFCDQDDIWLPHKISDAMAAIEKHPGVNLILQNSIICDEQLNHVGRIFPDMISEGLHPPQSQFGFWVWLGFLQTFRRDLILNFWEGARPRNYFPEHRFMSHDKWTCLIANAIGGIAVLPEPAALYRRHMNALTGDYGVQNLKKRIEKALPVGADHYAFLSEVADETAQYLRRLSNGAEPVIADEFCQSARGFDQICAILKARAALYMERRFAMRASIYLRIALQGGYIGPVMIALGWKSGAKDLLQVLGVLGRLTIREGA